MTKLKTCPNCGTELTPAKIAMDGRAAAWRVRVRLYNDAHPGDAVADSDPDLPPGSPGETVLFGLPAVAEHLAELAEAYHAGPCAGLERETLLHRLKALRPTLSRNNGYGAWRVKYTTAGKAQREVGWLARVDVQREN